MADFTQGFEPYDSTLVTVTQAGHGFVMPGRGFIPVYKNGSNWELARANDENTLHEGFIVTIVDANTFMVQSAGMLVVTGHGLTDKKYYLSAAAAGATTATRPVLPGQYADPLCIVINTNTVELLNRTVEPIHSQLFTKPVREPGKVFNGMDAGWVDWYGGGSSFDTTDFYSGSSSLKISTDATGSLFGARLFQSPQDWSGNNVKIRFKASDYASLTELSMFVGTDAGITTNYTVNITTLFADPMADNEWQEVIFPRSAFTAFGAANWATVDDIFFRVQATAGNAVDVWVDNIELVPVPSKGVVTISFDDGYNSTHTAKRYMDGYGYRGTSFAIPDLIDEPGYLTSAQLESLDDAGWDISGHHETNLTTMTRPERIEELRKVHHWLREGGYTGAEHFSYPNGAYNREVMDDVSRFFASARTIDNFNQPQNHILPEKVSAITIADITAVSSITAWIDEAIANGEWIILTFHILTETAPTVPTEYLRTNFQSVIDHLNSVDALVLPYSEVMAMDWTSNTVTATAGTPASTTTTITQAAHGFTMPGRGFIPVYKNGSVWTEARANDQDTLHQGFIVSITDTNTFEMQFDGILEATGHALTDDYYFLSSAAAGAVTATEPTASGTYSAPVASVIDTNHVHLRTNRPVGGVAVGSNTGTGTVATTGSTGVVNHGLTGTPSWVGVTFTDYGGAAPGFEVTAIGATSFTVNMTGNPPSTASFIWKAEI